MTRARAARDTTPMPPANLDAERAVLGATLIEGADILQTVLGELEVPDFYSEAHRKVFRHLLELQEANVAVDVITLRDALTESGSIDEVGGAAFLAQIVDPLVAGLPAHLDEYVRIIKEHAARREAIQELERALNQARGADSNGAGSAKFDVADVAGRLQQIAARAHPTSDAKGHPQLVREGIDLTMTWHGDLRLTLTAVRVTKRGVEGELTVYRGLRSLHWGALNLTSGPAREGLVRKLRDTTPAVPWREILEEACAQFTAAAREGEPIVQLTGDAPLTTQDLVAPFVLDGQTTTVFADGDSGKSLLAGALSLALASGRPLPGGLRPHRQAPVMVLDWETDRRPWDGRLAALCAGLGLDMPDGIHYRQMTAALVDDVAMLAAEVARRRVGLVIVDSLAPACGPEPDGTDAVVRTLNAMRLFAPAARLVLAHVSKADADKRTGARPFGSVFTWNLSRSLWEIRRDRDSTEPGLTIALHHRKCNVGPQHSPLGFRFVFGSDTITPYPVDLRDSPQLTAGASLAWRVQLALAQGRTTAEMLAETLEADVETVRRTLRRLRKRDKARDFEDGTWGLPA